MRGRWAAGIVPRNFTWVIQDRLAVCERPGGYSPNHRKVRRQEEILWINGQRFSRVISLLPSNHNLHAYDERNLPCAHFPLASNIDVSEILAELYPALLHWLRNGERLLMHQEELGERVSGVVAGFLCWSGVLPEPPRAISATEQLFKRQMGAAGRTIVALSIALPPPPEPMLAFKSADASVPREIDDTTTQSPLDADPAVALNASREPEAEAHDDGGRTRPGVRQGAKKRADAKSATLA